MNHEPVIKALLSELPAKLMQIIKHPKDSSVVTESFDILSELLERYGTQFNENQLLEILNLCKGTLYNPSIPIRKRVIVCLGSLTRVASPSYFSDVIRHVLAGIESYFNNTPVAGGGKRNSSDNLKTLCDSHQI